MSQPKNIRKTPPDPEEAPTVAHVAECYVHGSENWIHTQVSHLREHAPFVLTGKTKNHEQLDWVPPCYKTFGRPLPVRAVDRIGEGVLGYRPTRRWHLYRHDATLIHAHFGPMGVKILPLAAAADVPLVTTFYGYDLSLLPEREPEWRSRYQTLFERGTHFLVEGGHMKEQLVELGCPREKVTVQHLGVDVEAFPVEKRTRSREEPLRILVAGRFTEKKGIPDAINAFGQFIHGGGNGKLTIVGGLRHDAKDQAARKKIRALVDEQNVTDRVTVKEFLPHDQLVEMYTRHHVFLSPSVHASDGDNEGGAPVSIIEASATGMPIVGTWHCDIPEVVQHDKTGLLAREGDVEELAAHLDTLYRDRSLLKEMGQAGRDHVEREYDARTQGKRLDELYKEIREE